MVWGACRRRGGLEEGEKGSEGAREGKANRTKGKGERGSVYLPRGAQVDEAILGVEVREGVLRGEGGGWGVGGDFVDEFGEGGGGVAGGGHLFVGLLCWSRVWLASTRFGGGGGGEGGTERRGHTGVDGGGGRAKPEARRGYADSLSRAACLRPSFSFCWARRFWLS